MLHALLLPSFIIENPILRKKLFLWDLSFILWWSRWWWWLTDDSFKPLDCANSHFKIENCSNKVILYLFTSFFKSISPQSSLVRAGIRSHKLATQHIRKSVCEFYAWYEMNVQRKSNIQSLAFHFSSDMIPKALWSLAV